MSNTVAPQPNLRHFAGNSPAFDVVDGRVMTLPGSTAPSFTPDVATKTSAAPSGQYSASTTTAVRQSVAARGAAAERNASATDHGMWVAACVAGGSALTLALVATAIHGFSPGSNATATAKGHKTQAETQVDKDCIGTDDAGARLDYAAAAQTALHSLNGHGGHAQQHGGDSGDEATQPKTITRARSNEIHKSYVPAAGDRINTKALIGEDLRPAESTRPLAMPVR